jgi:ribosomal protein S12 methylthiotransferase accessory factor
MYHELEEWVSAHVHPHHGIIRSIRELPKVPGFPSIFRVAATSSDHFVVAGTSEVTQKRGAKRGLGHSEDFARACWSAIGESIERYAAGLYDPARAVAATAAELGGVEYMEDMILQETALAPKKTPPFEKYTSHAKLTWSPAYRHDTAETTWVPSQLVWFGLRPQFDGEKRIGQVTSNGLGAGRTLHGALCRGILELIERDALMIGWFLDAPWNRIQMTPEVEETIPGSLRAYCRDHDVDISFYYLRTELRIPAVLCVMYSDRFSVLALGASASVDPALAVEKAAYEALMIYSDQFQCANEGFPIPEAGEFAGFRDHAAYYRDATRSAEARRHFEHCEAMYLCDLPSLCPKGCDDVDVWDAICDELRSWGYCVVSSDLSAEDVTDAGFRVVKVFVPGLQPLLFGPVIPGDVRRLVKCRENLGFARADIRRVVHPFA